MEILSEASPSARRRSRQRLSFLAAAEQVIRRVGIEGFSLRETARQAGVAPSALSHHFGSVAALLSEIAILAYSELAEYISRVEPTGIPVADLRAYVTAYVDYAIDHPGRFRVMSRNDLVDRSHPGYAQAMTNAVRPLARAAANYHGVLMPRSSRDKVPPALLATIAAAHGIAILAIEEQWIFALDEVDPKSDFAKRLLPGVLSAAWPERNEGLPLRKSGLTDGDEFRSQAQPIAPKLGMHRQDRRVTQTRASLRQALLELLDEKRLSEISAAMIAARAGVGYATFFRHFASPEALLLYVADQVIGEAVVAVTPAFLDRNYRQGFAILTGYVQSNRAELQSLIGSTGSLMEQAFQERASQQIEGELVALGVSMPSSLAIQHGISSTISVLKWWLQTAPDTDPLRVADLLDQLVRRPLIN